jgi:hypothetical protein
MAVRKKRKKPSTRPTQARKRALTAQTFKLMKALDPTSVAREGELAAPLTSAQRKRALAILGKAAGGAKKKPPPRAPGSERSFAFTSVDAKGRKTTRFSDKPTPRKGEKRKRFK